MKEKLVFSKKKLLEFSPCCVAFFKKKIWNFRAVAVSKKKRKEKTFLSKDFISRQT